MIICNLRQNKYGKRRNATPTIRVVPIVVLFCLTVILIIFPTVSHGDETGSRFFWESIGGPNGDTDLRDIVIDPRDDNIWYVGSQNNGLYVTRDGGNSWTSFLGGTIGSIVIDPYYYDIYASSGSDLYRSTDLGLSWDLVVPFPNTIPGPSGDSPTFINSVLVSYSPGWIAVGLSSTLHSARIYLTNDHGGTWWVSWESPIGYHIWDMLEDPYWGSWTFCTEDANHNANPVVMRSIDMGTTWQEIPALTGVPTSGHGLNLDINFWTGTIYFLRECSLLSVSNDSGVTWSPSGAHFVGFGSTMLLDSGCPNRIFGGEMVRGLSDGGVFVSEDWGQTFSFLGLPNNTVSSLAIDSSSTILIAVSDYGLWTMDLTIDDNISCDGFWTILSDGFESGDTYRWSISED